MRDFRLIDHIHTAVAIIDKDLAIVNANKAFRQRSKIKENNIAGTKCFNSAYQFSEPCNITTTASCPVKESFKSKKSSSTIHHLWIDNHAIVEEIITTPIFDKNGEVNFVVEEFRDLSKLLGLQKGIISICSYCRKIKDKNGQWLTFEAYLLKHTGANFSHGICSECNEEIMKEVAKKNSCTH